MPIPRPPPYLMALLERGSGRRGGAPDSSPSDRREARAADRQLDRDAGRQDQRLARPRRPLPRARKHAVDRGWARSRAGPTAMPANSRICSTISVSRRPSLRTSSPVLPHCDSSSTTPSARLSAAERITASGVRSSCDTVATNSSCCRASICARRVDSTRRPDARPEHAEDPGADGEIAPARGVDRQLERTRRVLHEQAPVWRARHRDARAGRRHDRIVDRLRGGRAALLHDDRQGRGVGEGEARRARRDRLTRATRSACARAAGGRLGSGGEEGANRLTSAASGPKSCTRSWRRSSDASLGIRARREVGGRVIEGPAGHRAHDRQLVLEAVILLLEVFPGERRQHLVADVTAIQQQDHVGHVARDPAPPPAECCPA